MTRRSTDNPNDAPPPAPPGVGDRRRGSDRRNQAARKRHIESRRLCVEVCHSVLRVAVVVQGEERELPLLHASTLRWRVNAPDLLSELGQTELSAALSRIVGEQRLAGCPVSIAINGTLCVNRSSSGGTAEVEKQIASLEDRSQLYLALGPGPKTIGIDRKQIDARHEHALVTVTNSKTLELLIAAAESAGLVVDVVESALVSLSRLQGLIEPDEDSAVLLAQLDEGRFELGVCRAGQLMLEYRPASDADVTQLGSVVDDHHERLVRFCSRQYGHQRVPLERMWLIGETVDLENADTTTRKRIRTGVLRLTAIDELWRFDGETRPTAKMGAALGLALRDRFEERGVSPNLMAAIRASAKPPLRPALIRAAAPLAATLLVAVGFALFNLEQSYELAAISDRVEQLRPELLRGERLAREISDSAQESEELARLASKTPRRNVSDLVQGVAQCLPEEVWLRTVRVTEPGRVELSGSSLTESGIYDSVRNLEGNPAVREVALRGTRFEQTNRGPTTTFDIDLELSQASLAGGVRDED